MVSSPLFPKGSQDPLDSRMFLNSRKIDILLLLKPGKGPISLGEYDRIRDLLLYMWHYGSHKIGLLPAVF